MIHEDGIVRTHHVGQKYMYYIPWETSIVDSEALWKDRLSGVDGSCTDESQNHRNFAKRRNSMMSKRVKRTLKAPYA